MRFLHLFGFFYCFKGQMEKDRLLFHYVFKKNHTKVLKLLKKGANPNTTISYNEPIDIAIHNNDLEMIKILIFYGATMKEDSRMFCRDCRRNFDYIDLMYNFHKKILESHLYSICLKYKIPPGLDNYLKQFFIET